MCDTKDKLIEQASGVLEKTYEDVVHPSAKSIGNTLSLVPRTVGVWLGKWEKWILNGEYAIKETEVLLAEKLKHIPEDKIVEPEPYVAVPAIQQLSYSLDSEELRELYANLLASSMNADKKSDVHPAFVDIIKQLAPDEAKLLRFLSHQYVIPLVEIRQKSSDGKGFTVLEKYHLSIPNGVLEMPQNTPVYIENLMRLQLIEIPADTHYTTESLYTPLETHIVFVDVPNESITYGRKIINVTPFGRNFVKICQ